MFLTPLLNVKSRILINRHTTYSSIVVIKDQHLILPLPSQIATFFSIFALSCPVIKAKRLSPIKRLVKRKNTGSIKIQPGQGFWQPINMIRETIRSSLVHGQNNIHLMKIKKMFCNLDNLVKIPNSQI